MGPVDDIDDEWPEGEEGRELFGWSLGADGADCLRLGLRYASSSGSDGADYLRLVVPAEAAYYLVEALTRRIRALSGPVNKSVPAANGRRVGTECA
jgi:hypothetical protein